MAIVRGAGSAQARLIEKAKHRCSPCMRMLHTDDGLYLRWNSAQHGIAALFDEDQKSEQYNSNFLAFPASIFTLIEKSCRKITNSHKNAVMLNWCRVWAKKKPAAGAG
ncbi:hypothetical protein ACWYXJ_00475 [Janthinobacterium lividum]|uniref:hypothetical protein n=1 Tax=Janthinobacterium sp. BJB446 TaxID=2048009 RepID=UPI00117AD77A|nr:hypothetical protein [Janthinobacterium sp. BJB446]